MSEFQYKPITNKKLCTFWEKKSYNRIPHILSLDLLGFKLHDFFESIRSTHKILLESSKQDKNNVFSIIGVRADSFFHVKGNMVYTEKGSYTSSEHLSELRAIIDKWNAPCLDDLVSLPLYGGAIGFFSYEASRFFDSIRFSNLKRSKHSFFDYAFWFYDEIFVFNHKTNVLYLCASASCYKDALKKMANLQEDLGYYDCNKPIKSKRSKVLSEFCGSSFEYKNYIDAIEKSRDYIARGHSYQINLAQRLKCKTTMSSWDVYKKLMAINPVSYGAYLKVNPFDIVCGSPELLVRKRCNQLWARPIAGTRRRGTLDEDIKFYQELREDSKEKAEHAMLVDLMRNDLGKVSQVGSVRISSYADIINYTHVMHIESELASTIKEDVHPLDVIGAVFPGGTVTGVPKLRTMEIIDELETEDRNIYTGTIGYISYVKELEFNIVIRSMVFSGNDVSFHVGGGLTYDCIPRREYKETMNKARSQLLALGVLDEI